jgi:hypothetical protein
MPSNSKWIIGFGVLLLGCALAGWMIDPWVVRVAGGNGLAMIAAGVAAAQGRRSLRRTGLLVGFLLPAVLAAVASWRAMQLWIHRAEGDVSQAQPILVSCLAAVSLIMLLVLVRLRLSQSSSIAERGYSVTTPTHFTSPAEPQRPAKQRVDRS